MQTGTNYNVLIEKIRTPITDLFKINHPILLAGMNVAAGPKLAAAVTNAGGLGVIGGLSYSPEMLREQIDELKSYLHDKNAPFGVDLLLPQVGGNARKTKYVIMSHSYLQRVIASVPSTKLTYCHTVMTTRKESLTS